MTTITEEEKKEQHAYECGREVFYQCLFGIIPKDSIAVDIINSIPGFFKHIANEEGFESVEDVLDMVSMIKSLPRKNRDEMMQTCPSEFLKGFVKKYIK
jgi:hypothetical protein